MGIVHSKPTITRKELEGVLDCLISDQLITGDTVKIFEKNLSELIGLKFCAATNSLTSAYHLAFSALELKAEDEVIIPSFFNSASLYALSLLNAKAVPVDIAEKSLTPEFEQIKAKITENTKAIVIGHISGSNSSIEEPEELKKLKIPIIEDISHSIGAEVDDKPVGNRASLTICSFSPYDIITTGNGGAVLTKNSRYYSIIKELRFNEKTTNYDYTMTDFQGAMGISQLSSLQDFIKRRKEIAGIYYDRIRFTSHKSLYPFNNNFIYQSFPVIFDASIEKVTNYWKKNDVQIYHPISTPLHTRLGLKSMHYPYSERMSKKMFSLPIYPTLTRKEIDKISRALAKFI